MTAPLVYIFQRTGSAHRFCQDRYRVIRCGDRLILVAADGHGGRPYVRSGLGARIACAAAEAALAGQMDPAEIPAAIKDHYDALVTKHLALRPLESWELERLGDRPAAEAYGTTLLAAVITPSCTGLMQLGDGDLHALGFDGAFLSGLTEDTNCRGNLTTSLANGRDHVLARFRTAWFDQPAAAVVMFTDGCEGGLLRAVEAVAAPSGPEEELQCLLRETARGDDQTVLLACVPEITGDEEFRVALAGHLAQMREDLRRQRQKRRERVELAELENYLLLAMRKAERMSKANDPGLMEYLEKLRPSILRMNELRDLLEATPKKEMSTNARTV